ncbi:MAG: hypothetical protein ACD_41C00364G0002 [uncultured bacterium]|nr:MAG: hypothetical protein ACD_41C00364G0002 [uncultured bacterium]HBY73574.1 hypothetical protein [Candidatus Kerfeldbacteria bacterium]
MHYNFCTLFDKNYATRGLALHASLLRQAGDFTLWILCMDDIVYDILTKLKLEQVELIRLSALEDDELRQVKTTRTAVEYCWTLTPSLPLYVLTQHPELDHVTYLDADTYFFSSPQPLYDEWKNQSILIVSHNYAPRFNYKVAESGIYNVEFLIFRNDAAGLACLRWWRERCNEWCYFRLEDGKLGDQMYLNDWPTRFQHVVVAQHLVGGVAPWNIERFSFHQANNQIMIDNLPVIFFHYHAFKLYSTNAYDPLVGYYYCPALIRRLIYQPYAQALQQSLQCIQTIQPDFNFGFTAITVFQRVRRQVVLQLMNLPPFNWTYRLWKS